MRNVFFLLLLIVGSTACKSGEHTTQHKYIPKSLHSLYLGMPKADAIKARPNMKLAKEESFRTAYLEEINDGTFESIVYYFDSDAPNVLYEIIIIYKDETVRDNVANTLFGEPNSENREQWYFKSKENFRIHCWKYKNKLIIVGKIYGTEWEEAPE